MNWHTNKISDDSYLIQYGDFVVGSIDRVCGRWTVEILWTGFTKDVKGDFSDYVLALAFVEGVEKTLAATRFQA